MTKVHEADSENGPPRLPKTVEKKLFQKFPMSTPFLPDYWQFQINA